MNRLVFITFLTLLFPSRLIAFQLESKVFKLKTYTAIHSYNPNVSVLDSNYVSHLTLTDSKSGDTFFSTPCDRLTHLVLDKTGKYLIGLSNLNYASPHNVVVFNLIGDVLFQRHVASLEVKMTTTNWEKYKVNFPDVSRQLDSLNRVWPGLNDAVYIDILGLGIKENNQAAWHALKTNNEYVSNHLCACIKTSTQGLVFYSVTNPVKALRVDKDGVVRGLILNSEDGENVINLLP